MKLDNGQYDFKKDIVTGEKGQELVRKFLENQGMTFLEECNNSNYDLKMSGSKGVFTFEIKTDVYPKDTGNMVIEFESRGKASGINVTQADYFIYYFPAFNELWIAKVSKLKHFVKNNKLKIFEQAGDKGSNTRLYRLPKKDAPKWFKRHSL